MHAGFGRYLPPVALSILFEFLAVQKKSRPEGRLISLLMRSEGVCTCKTDLANFLALVIDNLIGAAAEVAAGLEFLENYPIAVYEKFNGVVVGNAEISAYFLRNDDSAKLVYVSYNTGCFHFGYRLLNFIEVKRRFRCRFQSTVYYFST